MRCTPVVSEGIQMLVALCWTNWTWCQFSDSSDHILNQEGLFLRLKPSNKSAQRLNQNPFRLKAAISLVF